MCLKSTLKSCSWAPELGLITNTRIKGNVDRCRKNSQTQQKTISGFNSFESLVFNPLVINNWSQYL